jgi:hypothetical protein
MKPRSLVPLSALAALLLSAGRASAEEDPGLRPRAGFDIGGGTFIAPGFGTFGALGLHVYVGVQFNNLLALYLLPELGFVFAKPTQYVEDAALLVDFTFGRLISVGVGPEAGLYGQDSGGFGPPAPVHYTSGLYGGRLRLTYRPLSRLDSFLSLTTASLDLRVLRGRTFLVTTPDPRSYVTVVLPMLSFGFDLGH